MLRNQPATLKHGSHRIRPAFPTPSVRFLADSPEASRALVPSLDGENMAESTAKLWENDK